MCSGPPRRVPGNPVMLVDYEIEPRLGAVPLARLDNGGPHSTAAHKFDVLDDFLGGTTGKAVGKPENLVSALSQAAQVSERNPFRPAAQGILRVPPVQHQESHRGPAASLA